jgi:hypothetical protein
MKKVLIVLALSCVAQMPAHAQSILGPAAESFAVLGGQSVTNTGPTTIYGNVGVSPGTSITGFPPGNITGGTIHQTDALAAQAQLDVTTTYNVLAAEPFTAGHDLSGVNLGGMTLTPGVYHFSSAAQLTGVLILDAQGQISPRFDFQIGSDLITSSTSLVELINGGSGDTVYWQVGSSATLGTNSTFLGNVLSLSSITATTGATDPCGRLLARNGDVTLDSNNIGACGATIPGVPEPSVNALLGSVFCSGLGMIVLRRKKVCKV